MKSLKTKVSAFFIIAFMINGTAQETITPSGGNAIGNNGNISFTVGQIIYDTQIGSTGSLAQGIQQPFEISVVYEIDGTRSIILHSKVYPNPVVESTTLSIENYNIENLRYLVVDINGRSLEGDKIRNKETLIVMENYSEAVYFIKIMKNNTEIKTFKIIKSN